MFRFRLIILFYLSTILLSCRSTDSRIDSSAYSKFQNKGDELTNLAQATLLGNVGKAIQEGGTEYAVEFCNLKANSIIDSLNAVNNCIISRTSEKNRNPNNNLKNKSEKRIIQLMDSGMLHDTLIRAYNTITYYKPIKIGIEACLKCHGNTDTDIDTKTLQKISQLYPEDLATGYKLNDFRGMWKIEFSITEM